MRRRRRISPAGSGEGEAQIIGRVDPTYTVEPGTIVDLGVDADRLQFFDLRAARRCASDQDPIVHSLQRCSCNRLHSGGRVALPVSWATRPEGGHRLSRRRTFTLGLLVCVVIVSASLVVATAVAAPKRTQAGTITMAMNEQDGRAWTS